jgi:hypothetical protein
MKSTWKQFIFALLFAASFLGFRAPAYADVTGQQARSVMDKWQNALVAIELTVKITVESHKSEIRMETLGTVVDSSGLVLTTRTEVQPDDIMKAYANEKGAGKLNLSSEVTDLKVRFADGTEIPGKVVLQDKDLDMAFIMPSRKPATPIKSLDLAHSANPSVMDPIVILEKLGSTAGRSTAVSMTRIMSVVEKPRKFFLPDACVASVGSPVFTLEGDLVGVLLARVATNSSSVHSTLYYSSSAHIILPAVDIQEAVKQALETTSK